MPLPAGPPAPVCPPPQQMLLIWETAVVTGPDGRVVLRPDKPLSRMSTGQAARTLGTSAWTIRKLFRLGILRGYKPGAICERRDERGSNAALVLDAESVLIYKQRQQQRAREEQQR